MRPATRVPAARTLSAAALCAVFCALAARAEEAADDTEKEAPTPPRWHLRNGSRIGGDVAIDEMTVETRYGTLRIPLSEIVSVRFAPRLTDEEREQVGDALRKLAAESDSEREEGMATLKRIGPAALPVLRTAVRAAAPARAARVEEVYSEILRTTTRDTTSYTVLAPLFGYEEDQIVTHRFRVRGLVRQDVFHLLSPYGKLEVARADLAAITFDVGHTARAEVEIDALKLVPENWLRTAIEVNRGDKLAITASGQLNQPNYGIVCGPEGTTRYSGSTFNGMPMLSLVGKIGRRGKPFLIGRKLRDKASQSGFIYLGIVPFRRNYVAQGRYEVKITVNP